MHYVDSVTEIYNCIVYCMIIEYLLAHYYVILITLSLWQEKYWSLLYGWHVMFILGSSFRRHH